MNKSKTSRIFIFLECLECTTNKIKQSKGISRYLTSKNRRNTVEKIELLKHCKYCNKHTIHKEIK